MIAKSEDSGHTNKSYRGAKSIYFCALGKSAFFMKNNQSKITSANRQKKEVIVAEITAKVQKSKGIVFTNYQGLTHQQIEGFKKTIKAHDADYVVAKNTLLLRSLENYTLSETDREQFQQPTAALFMFADPVEPLKQLSKIIKEMKLPVIKFGIIDGKVIDAGQVEKLATLPPLPVLRAQLLGQLLSPISGLHRALNWNLQRLVLTLNAIQQQKS
jgi:large subunit ribosomal protein L10